MINEVQLKDLKQGSKFMFLKDDEVFTVFYARDWRNVVSYAADETKRLIDVHCSLWVRAITEPAI